MTLRVDMVACDGIGQCALVAPGLVELDRWGYPVVREDAGTDDDRSARRAAAAARRAAAAARRAVRACPRRALWLEEAAASIARGTRV
ncbi:ferredoxin [Actinotalea fermentans]|uniref:Ferredoxin n=1 Tax=Actinotalea fermentans TaxID=43671 RepID=A0A511Z108_9CELL|nr:ferredoxin [Actinotalea fermentans]GEN81123.1 hypothetical protein AFE02nite_28570 [Actinotalea fermentans]